MVRTSCRRNVRILLVGDKNVGKTSIILSLVSEEFPEDVPAKAEEITIPADVTPELVPTNIIDYSESEQSDDALNEEIHKAHVVCVIYSAVEPETLKRVSTHWLPLVRRNASENYCPVILVGNKVDLAEESTYDEAKNIMDEFSEIESFVECSAKLLMNISELFYYAQNAVLHPTIPIYISDKQELTDACKQALTRIFKICDKDNDGLLSDKELNDFQKACFDTPLRKEAFQDIKTIISRNVAGGISPKNGAITLTGFLYLHSLFMQRGRSQTTWAVLRRFGYEENLDFSKEYLYPKLTVPAGCTSELSYKGQQFLSLLFEKHDRHKVGTLSLRKEIRRIFSICPKPAFNSCVADLVPTVENGSLTAVGWMCFWTYTTLYYPATTMEYLAYFGYPISDTENQTTALHVTREKKLDLAKKQSLRTVYVCHVIGERGSGKLSLCRSHIGKTLQDSNRSSGEHANCTINLLHVYGQEKYLVLKNIDISNTLEPLMPDDINCDVACLVYDSSHADSFEYIARVFLKYYSSSPIPVLIVANKSDLGEVRQEYICQPDAFCTQHSLMQPIKFSSARPSKELFVKLATMAAFPHLYNMGFIGSYEVVNIWTAGISVAVIAFLAALITKLFKPERAK